MPKCDRCGTEVDITYNMGLPHGANYVCQKCRTDIHEGKPIFLTNSQKTRQDILNSAINLVCSDRERQYGPPEDNFDGIARLIYAYLYIRYIKPNKEFKVTAEDVGNILSLVKIGRIASGQVKADNYIDLAGYAACAGEIATKEGND